MKRLGVIGGMGPEATAYCYDQIIGHTKATRDQDHIDMVILSVASMPDRTEAIASGEAGPLLAKMAEATAALEGLGCANIAIPCNTSHYFYDQIQATTHVPIIHMPRETVRYIVEGARDASTRRGDALVREPVRIGIMGTDGTVGSGVYDGACAAFGAQAVIPSPERQRDVMSIIYDDVKAGREPDLRKFLDVVGELRDRGCDCIVLACTELSVLKRYLQMPEDVIDAMDVLVHEAVVRSGAVYQA